jgi:hypothetical protein
MSDFWDQRYGEPGYKYGTEPNAFLREQEVHWPRSARVLLPGDGEGRNGVWVARQGHRVETVDASKVGVEKSRALAAEHGVEVLSVHADLATWTSAHQFDVVGLCFLHLPPSLRIAVHRRLLERVLPGGWVVLEAFHPRQLGRTSGGPRDAALLYTLADVRADFSGGVEEVLGAEVEVTLAEGEGHRGPGVVTRFVARRR